MHTYFHIHTSCMRCLSKERTRDRVTTIRHDSCILHNKDGDVHVVD